MSPKFQKVHCPPLWQIQTNFLNISVVYRFGHLVSSRLGRFVERNGVLLNTQFDYWKCLGTCGSLLCVSHTLQGAMESADSALRLAKCKLTSALPLKMSTIGKFSISSSVGIGDSLLSMLAQFLSTRSQHVMVDNCRSKLDSVVSGVLQKNVSVPLLFLLHTSELCRYFSLSLMFISMIAIVPSPVVRVAVAETLDNDHSKVSESCNLGKVECE